MGLRGPKRGWKKAAAAKAAAAPSKPAKKAQAAKKAPVKAAPARKVSERVDKHVTKHLADVITLPVAHRENPEKLGGEALKALAHRRGLAKSEVARMSDEKIREQLKYRAYSQYHDEAA